MHHANLTADDENDGDEENDCKEHDGDENL